MLQRLAIWTSLQGTWWVHSSVNPRHNRMLSCVYNMLGTKVYLFMNWKCIENLILRILKCFGVTTSIAYMYFQTKNWTHNCLILLIRETFIFATLLKTVFKNTLGSLWYDHYFLSSLMGLDDPSSCISESESTISAVNTFFLLNLFGIFRPSREFFTQMETSPLTVKGRKFWPMLGTHGHWAVRVL